MGMEIPPEPRSSLFNNSPDCRYMAGSFPDYKNPLEINNLIQNNAI